jgi:hypothetical protein
VAAVSSVALLFWHASYVACCNLCSGHRHPLTCCVRCSCCPDCKFPGDDCPLCKITLSPPLHCIISSPHGAPLNNTRCSSAPPRVRFKFTITLTLERSGRRLQALFSSALHRKVAKEGRQHAALPYVPPRMGHPVRLRQRMLRRVGRHPCIWRQARQLKSASAQVRQQLAAGLRLPPPPKTAHVESGHELKLRVSQLARSNAYLCRDLGVILPAQHDLEQLAVLGQQ